MSLPPPSGPRPDAGGGLWSVGYEGRDIESFVVLLAGHRIDVVADVRLAPVSRKPSFSRTRLTQALAGAGIGYVHLRALGNPRDNRDPFRRGRVDSGRARFLEVLAGEEARADLRRLTELARHSRVAVLCFERDHARCHRQVVLDEARERAALPVHLLG